MFGRYGDRTFISVFLFEIGRKKKASPFPLRRKTDLVDEGAVFMRAYPTRFAMTAARVSFRRSGRR